MLAVEFSPICQFGAERVTPRSYSLSVPEEQEGTAAETVRESEEAQRGVEADGDQRIALSESYRGINVNIVNFAPDSVPEPGGLPPVDAPVDVDNAPGDAGPRQDGQPAAPPE